MKIPFLSLKRQYQELETEIFQSLQTVFERSSFILADEVENFEAEWSKFCGVPAAAGVASGTDALSLALTASGAVRRGQNDEVITTPLTAGYTALAIVNAGGVPVFADIDADTFTLDPKAIESAVTPRTRAIVPVHLYGQMADMKAILEIAGRYNLIVIEDAAQAHGASFDGKRAGGFGHASAFSFYPTKNLGACGDGGAVVSNNAEIIERVKILRQGGQETALRCDSSVGLNSRLDEMQAAILRVKLKYLEQWNEKRRTLARFYNEALKETDLVLPFKRESSAHVYHLYVVQHNKREKLRRHLAERGVETLIHYPFLLHQQPLFKRSEQPALPVAENCVDKIFSLPLYPQLSTEEAAEVVQAILDF